MASDITPPPTPHRSRTIYGDGDSTPQNLTAKQAAFRARQGQNVAASEAANENLRLSLMGLSAGWWASDHAEEAQHFTGWNYCAIHSKAKQAMQATVKVCRRIPQDKGTMPKPALSGVRQKSSTNPDQPEYDLEPLPPTHPACKLLAKPNPRWSANLFWYMLSQQCNLTGSALIWTVRDRVGRPAELWIVPTALTRPQMPTQAMPEGAYWVTATGLFTMTGGYPAAYGVGALAGITIDARDIHPVRWPHPYLLADGMSPLAAGSVQIDLAEEIDQAAWAVLHNEVDPSLLISLDPTMQTDVQEMDRVEATINARRAGTNNKGKVMVMQGASIAQVHRTPSELDYSNSRAQTRDGVLAIHSVSPIFCGIAEAGSQAAYFTSLKQSIELSVQPELDLAAGELTRLIQKLFKDDTIEVVITAKSFDDPDVLERKRQTNVSAKSVTINEDRALSGLPPVPWGDLQVGTQVDAGKINPDYTAPKPEAPPGFAGQPAQVGNGNDEIDDAAESGQPDAADESSTGMRKPELTGIRTGKSKSGEMPRAIRERLDSCMLNGFHHPRTKAEQSRGQPGNAGQFGPGGGGSSDDDSSSGGKKPDGKPEKPASPAKPAGRSPTAAFMDDANELAYGLESGDTDPDTFEESVGGLVGELESALADRMDSYQAGEVAEMEKIHGEAIVNHPEAEAALSDYETELAEIKSDMVSLADAVHQTTADLADAVREGDEDTIASAMAAYDSAMDEYITEREQVAGRMTAATETYGQRLSEVTDQLSSAANETSERLNDEYGENSEEAQAEADAFNAQMEEDGNPFRVEWVNGEDEGEGQWSWHIPEKDEKRAKAALRIRAKRLSVAGGVI